MPKVTELWAWTIEDTGPDDEGIPAFLDPASDTWTPMVGADYQRALSLKGEAQKVADLAGKPVRLRRALQLDEVLVLEPRR